MTSPTLLTGFIVSFLGQLPIGSINLIATQITVKESLRAGFAYAVGICLVEMIYLRIILAALHSFQMNSIYFSYAKYVVAIVMFFLAYKSFKSYKKQLLFKYEDEITQRKIGRAHV